MNATHLMVDGNVVRSITVSKADILTLPSRVTHVGDAPIAHRCIGAASAVPATCARPATAGSRLRACLGLAVVGAATAAVLSFCGAGEAPQPAVAFEEVLIEPGDSLWSLAASHPVAGLDASEAIELMRERNELTSATLQPGMELFIPVARA